MKKKGSERIRDIRIMSDKNYISREKFMKYTLFYVFIIYLAPHTLRPFLFYGISLVTILSVNNNEK